MNIKIKFNYSAWRELFISKYGICGRKLNYIFLAEAMKQLVRIILHY